MWGGVLLLMMIWRTFVYADLETVVIVLNDVDSFNTVRLLGV